MFKRIFAILLSALFLILTLNACSKSDKKAEISSTAGEETAQRTEPQTADIIGIWYSEYGNSVFTFDRDGVSRIYSLCAGYYEYSTCETGTYSFDGTTLTIVFDEQTDTVPCTLGADGQTLTLTLDATPTTFSRAQTLPQEHPVYSYPDFSAIAQTLSLSVPECTGLEIETSLVAQVRLQMATEFASENDLIGGIVEAGDVVLFDYRGYRIVDGEEENFSGGTAQKQTTVAGDGNGYVPGFGAGLIGHSTEEESFVVEVTFPENYHESLAGQTVYFAMKIHGIYPQISDETVAAATDGVYKTYADCFSDRLTDALKNNYAVLDLIPQIDFPDAEIPEEAYLFFLQSYLDNAHQSAYNYGISYESLLSYYKETPQSFLEEVTQQAKAEAKTQLVVQLYFHALNLEITEESAARYREELISLYLSEYAVTRDVIEDYLDRNPEELNDFVTMQVLLDHLIRENAFVAVK